MALKMSIETNTKTNFIAVGEEFDTIVKIENDGLTDIEVDRLDVALPTTTCTSSITNTVDKGISKKEAVLEQKESAEKVAVSKCQNTSNIKVGNVAAGTSRTVTIKSTLESTPLESKQELVAKAFDAKGALLAEAKSEAINFGKIEPIVKATIQPDKEVVVVENEFNYIIELTNEDLKEQANSVKVITSAPAEFEEMETRVDGATVPLGQIFALTVADGLDLSTIVAGETKTVTVKVKAAGVPTQNPYMSLTKGEYLTSEATPVTVPIKEVVDFPGVKVIKPELKVTKTINPDEAVIGDIVEFKILAENTGTVDLVDVVVFDPIDPNLVFIDGSVKVNGISYPNANVMSGVEIGDIPVGTSKEITFNVEVVNDANSIANNIAYVDISYVKDPSDPNSELVSERVTSDRVHVRIFDATLSITKVAATLQEPVMLGDTITYTVVIENTGDLDAESIIFRDFLPVGVKLNPDLITVTNSTIPTPFVLNNPNLESGVFVGLLEPGQTLQIVYTVEVTGGSCSGILVNEAFATYEYIFESGVRGNAETEHVSTRVTVGITNFSQLALNRICIVPCQKPSIEEINDVRVDSKILNSYVVKTYKGTSNEGHVLTGYKLIVNGLLKIFIEYTADLEEQPIHSYHCNVPFSDFIILPEDYEMGTTVNINIAIEDIDANMLNDREVETNIVYLLSANVCD